YSLGLVMQLIAGNSRNPSTGPTQRYAKDTTQRQVPLVSEHTSATFFALGQYYAQPAPALPPPLQDYPEITTSPGLDPLQCHPSTHSPLPLATNGSKPTSNSMTKSSTHFAEFAKYTRALLVSLGHHDLSRTPSEYATGGSQSLEQTAHSGGQDPHQPYSLTL
ncbi:hypothetical protein C0993_005960, partial [Termitomyces sp. T159_Od127]